MAAIGIFRAKDAAKAMGDNLQSLVDRGLLDPKNADEFGAALNYSAKQMEDLSDQAKVAGAALPQLQQALNDAGSARKQLDSLMVEGMSVNRGFFTNFGQQIRGGASAWDAFKSSGLDALGKISDKLVSMAADKLWASAFGGSSSGIGSLFGIGGGGSGSVPTWSGADLGAGTGGLSFPMFANGGTLSGGWGVVGERGPELINVHKGGVTVVPNHISKPFLPGFADGGTMSPNGMVSRLTAAGNSGPAVVMQDNRQINIGEGASAETVLQLREELARDRAARHADTVRIFHAAKKRREI
ncbi:hypothetical protein BwSF12_13040 [Bradyrhizobium ottawaense]|uniref:hypothetical protein n=1 Tax=Bradyrhizobium ottawaense TaxID=931866 RepID=UPI0027D5565F|nr:hypothetical protein BwSF12_13040 [Bradyrhizobium ottawaense]GMO92882.1 hypothetical protein BwSF19_72690 [Bradyrhizobium ottawaense]